MLVAISIVALATATGPCCCLADEGSLTGPGAICTAIFSVVLTIMTILPSNWMRELRTVDKSQRASLITLQDFNGCSDEQTMVPRELAENDSVSNNAHAIVICLTMATMILVGRFILWLVFTIKTYRENESSDEEGDDENYHKIN